MQFKKSYSMNALYSLIFCGCVILGGCMSYYEVQDVGSGKTYYTTKVKYNRSGAVEFKDSHTESKVVLQASEVKKISKERFKEMK